MKRTRRIGEMNYRDSDRDSERRSVWQSIVRTLMTAPAIFGNTQKIFAIGIVAMLLVIMCAVCVDAESNWNYQRRSANTFNSSEDDVQDSSIYPGKGVVLSKGWLDPGTVEYQFIIEKNVQVNTLNLNYIGKNNALIGKIDIRVYNWSMGEYEFITRANNDEPSEGHLWSIPMPTPENYVDYDGNIFVMFKANADSEYHLKEVGIVYTYNDLLLIDILKPTYDLSNETRLVNHVGNVQYVCEVDSDSSSGKIDLFTSVQAFPPNTAAYSYGKGELGGSVNTAQDGVYRIAIRYKVKGDIGYESFNILNMQASRTDFGLGLSIRDSSSDMVYEGNLYEQQLFSNDILDESIEFGKTVIATIVGFPSQPGHSAKAVKFDQTLTKTTYVFLKQGTYRINATAFTDSTADTFFSGEITSCADFSSEHEPWFDRDGTDNQYQGIWIEEIRIEKPLDGDQPPEDPPITSFEYDPKVVKEGTYAHVTLTFKNIGTTTITNPTYYYGAQVLYEETVDSLEPGGSKQFTVMANAIPLSEGATISNTARIEGFYNYGLSTYSKDFDVNINVIAGDTLTTTGTILETHTCDSITITATYSGDTDNDGYATVQYKESSPGGIWRNTGMSKSANQYTKTISGLSENTNYNFLVHYGDPDGVIGTTPLSISSINTGSCADNPPSAPTLYDPGTTDGDGSYF